MIPYIPYTQGWADDESGTDHPQWRVAFPLHKGFLANGPATRTQFSVGWRPRDTGAIDTIIWCNWSSEFERFSRVSKEGEGAVGMALPSLPLSLFRMARCSGSRAV